MSLDILDLVVLLGVLLGPVFSQLKHLEQQTNLRIAELEDVGHHKIQ